MYGVHTYTRRTCETWQTCHARTFMHTLYTYMCVYDGFAYWSKTLSLGRLAYRWEECGEAPPCLQKLLRKVSICF